LPLLLRLETLPLAALRRFGSRSDIRTRGMQGTDASALFQWAIILVCAKTIWNENRRWKHQPDAARWICKWMRITDWYSPFGDMKSIGYFEVFGTGLWC
jgi:hypothetical protein